jgi:hypothetical protein
MSGWWRLASVGIYASLSGCVFGYGHCLFTEPVKNTLAGHIHFHNYPTADGVDNVPILALDKTAYVYSPAESRECLAANDVQLVGLSEFPSNIEENTHVSVEGTLFAAATARQHTRFVVNVTSILPLSGIH